MNTKKSTTENRNPFSTGAFVGTLESFAQRFQDDEEVLLIGASARGTVAVIPVLFTHEESYPVAMDLQRFLNQSRVVEVWCLQEILVEFSPQVGGLPPVMVRRSLLREWLMEVAEECREWCGYGGLDLVGDTGSALVAFPPDLAGFEILRAEWTLGDVPLTHDEIVEDVMAYTSGEKTGPSELFMPYLRDEVAAA